MQKGTIIGLMVLLILAVVFLAPLAAFWSIKTLFGVAIPYTFKNCVAALLLIALANGNNGSSK